MKTHTPGPWRVNEHYESVGTQIESLPYDDGNIVARVFTTEGEEKNREQNAQLIATAPDLLNFAKSFFDSEQDQDRADVLRRAAAVISKAKGYTIAEKPVNSPDDMF